MKKIVITAVAIAAFTGAAFAYTKTSATEPDTGETTPATTATEPAETGSRHTVELPAHLGLVVLASPKPAGRGRRTPAI